MRAVVDEVVSPEDLGLLFARHVVGTTYAALPTDAVRAAKQSTLDTLGVMLGATGQMTALPGIVELARDWGGKPESTILGFGGKVPAPTAAFVNGATAHGLDFDDHLPEGHHPSSSLVAALFAVAERIGAVSGRDFITAMALGQDLFARLRKNVTWRQDWFMTPVIGSFAAAAACAKLLGLDERGVLDAFGAASCQTSGTMQLAYGTGGDLRGMYAGFAAKAGVFSALLAQAGVTGTTTPFEGDAGFLPVYFPGGYDRDGMLAGLGNDFQGSSILYKMWPSCGVTHAYIDTAMKLLTEVGGVESIQRIDVFGGDFARRLCEPADLRRRPPTPVDAKFSIPYTVAVALRHGTVGLGDFTDERRTDPATETLAAKVRFVDDPAYNWTSELPRGAVEFHLTDGRTLFSEAHHDVTPGSTKRPLTWEELTAKFADCAAYAVRPIDTQRRRRVIDQVDGLESLDDVSQVVDGLTRDGE